MENDYVKKILTTAILIILAVIAFFVLKPILLSIILGLLLVVVFEPLFTWMYKYTKSRNLTSGLLSVLLILVILLPIWFLTPIFIKQSFEVFQVAQQTDFVTPLKTIFPSLFASEEFSAEIGSVIYSFVTKATNSIVNSFSRLILNFPTLFLQMLVVFATFFFVLKDNEKFVLYIQSLTPFSRELERKLFNSSRDITISVIYGQVLVGFIQGAIVGLGFFIFNVPNFLFLTLLAILAGVLPIIGTSIIWIPVAIYLLIASNTIPAIGVSIFGVIGSGVDTILRPIIVSKFVPKETRMHPLLILIGMIGGLFLFGILGFILGPLILAYVLIMLELYRVRSSRDHGIFIK